MRALLPAAAFLLAAAPQGMAAEWHDRIIAHSDARTFHLPAEIDAPRTGMQDRAIDLPADFRPQAARPSAMHIGPIAAETIDGHTRYRLEGVSVMGGSVLGSVDGHGGKIFLRWSAQ